MYVRACGCDTHSCDRSMCTIRGPAVCACASKCGRRYYMTVLLCCASQCNARMAMPLRAVNECACDANVNGDMWWCCVNMHDPPCISQHPTHESTPRGTKIKEENASRRTRNRKCSMKVFKMLFEVLIWKGRRLSQQRSTSRCNVEATYERAAVNCGDPLMA